MSYDSWKCATPDRFEDPDPERCPDCGSEDPEHHVDGCELVPVLDGDQD